MRLLFLAILISVFGIINSQNNCEIGFVSDSLFLQKSNEYKIADCLVTPEFENTSTFKLFKVSNKYYLSIEYRNNLYFGKVGDLEVKSGSRSFYQTSITQQKKNDYTALFAFEIYKNYVATLKNDGITSFVFNGAENTFTKQEVKEIKKIAKCFYQTINIPKDKK